MLQILRPLLIIIIIENQINESLQRGTKRVDDISKLKIAIMYNTVQYKYQCQ